MELDRIIEVIAPIALSLFSAAMAYLAKYLREKAHNELASRAVSLLDEAVRTAVSEVQQTYVKEIKAARADGKLTDEEKAAAKGKAVARARELLAGMGASAVRRALGLEGGALSGALGAKVEAEVLHVPTKPFL